MPIKVFTSVDDQVWDTEKCRIATGNTPVTYNVYDVAKEDFIYSDNNQIPPHIVEYVYVGIGNKLTIVGADFTATESGSKGRQR